MRAAAIVALPLLVALSAGGVAQAAGWQPRDTARAAARVTHDLVGSAALRRMRRQLKRRVRVWVAPLRNRSSQHLPTRALDKTLHKSLAAASQLDLSRGGAPDLLLLPWFFTMADAEGGRELSEMFFIVEVVDVARARKVWVSVYRVRELVTRAKQRDVHGRPRVAVRVRRLSPKAGPYDLSGTFCGYDAVRLARGLARDLARKGKALQALGRVKMMGLRNRTSEHVNTKLLAALFVSELVRRAPIDLDAGYDARHALRALGSRGASLPRPRAMAKVLLSGKLLAQISAGKKSTVRTYMLTMQLVDMNMQKHWVGNKRLRKVVANKAARAGGAAKKDGF